jgi:uncharacterized protein (TIGR02594 family)
MALWLGADMQIEPGWLTIGRKLIGTKEIKGPKHNPLVVSMFARVGHKYVKDDETAWCAAFVGYCLEEAGIKSTKSLWALNYAEWGQKLKAPILGCVGVKRRYGRGGNVIGGHVIFVVAANADFIWGLGGNQGDSVSIVRFPRKEIFAFRWPTAVQIPSKPLPLPHSVNGASIGGTET